MERKKGRGKRGLEDVPDFSEIYVDQPTKVFPLEYAGNDRASQINAVGNVSIVLTMDGNVYTWGGGGNSPPNETALLGRSVGLKARNGEVRNITHIPTRVELGDFMVKKLKVSDDKSRIVAMEVDQRSANERMKDLVAH